MTEIFVKLPLSHVVEKFAVHVGELPGSETLEAALCPAMPLAEAEFGVAKRIRLSHIFCIAVRRRGRAMSYRRIKTRGTRRGRAGARERPRRRTRPEQAIAHKANQGEVVAEPFTALAFRLPSSPLIGWKRPEAQTFGAGEVVARTTRESDISSRPI